MFESVDQDRFFFFKYIFGCRERRSFMAAQELCNPVWGETLRKAKRLQKTCRHPPLTPLVFFIFLCSRSRSGSQCTLHAGLLIDLVLHCKWVIHISAGSCSKGGWSGGAALSSRCRNSLAWRSKRAGERALAASTQPCKCEWIANVSRGKKVCLSHVGDF